MSRDSPEHEGLGVDTARHAARSPHRTARRLRVLRPPLARLRLRHAGMTPIASIDERTQRAQFVRGETGITQRLVHL